jgi:excisionase family DNA binding protein
MEQNQMSAIDAKWNGRTTFKVKEAAEILSLSVWSTYEAIKGKRIPAVWIGRRVIVTRVALEEMLTSKAA